MINVGIMEKKFRLVKLQRLGLIGFLFLSTVVHAKNRQEARDAQKGKLISLQGSWRFKLDPSSTGITSKWYNQNLDDNITLPGTTDEGKKGDKTTNSETGRLTRVYQYYGAAWYQHDVDIPKNWTGKHITFLMERTKATTVFVDSILIGKQNTLAGKQLYDLTKLLTPGKHTINIIVNNQDKPPIGDPHQISDGTQTNWNGILGSIELQAYDAVWMDDVQLFPDVKTKSVKVHIKFGNLEKLPVNGSITVSASTWNVAKPTNIPAKTFPCQIDDDGNVDVVYPLGEQLQLWDEFSPTIHKFTIAFSAKSTDGNYSDKKIINTGIRDFKAVKTQFVVNGKTIFLRGKHDACVFPITGYAPMTVDGWLKVFRIAKSYGINHYRFHTWCPPEAAFAAADIAGIYMQPELPIWGSIGKQGEIRVGDVEQRTDNDPLAQRTAFLMAEGRHIFHDYGNYASFVMFALGNELGGSREVMADMVKQFRAIDNRHLFAQGSNNFLSSPHFSPGDDYWTTTLTGGHYGSGNYDPESRKKDVRSSYPSDTVGHLNNILDGTMYNYTHAIEGITVPVIGHEIGQYQVYPNFAEIKKYTGVVQARNFEIFKKRLEATGMGDEAEKFFKASGELAVICYREEIETALRTQGFGGFQLLDLQDFPGQGTALVGILDAFMDSKGLIEPVEWKQFCNDVVPLLKMPQFVWSNTAHFTAEADLANYGATAFTTKPIWVITNSKGEKLFSGQLANAVLQQGKLTPIGKIDVDLSSIKQPQKLNITLQVGKYRNTYPIWVYPPVTPSKNTNGILVSTQLDKPTMDALNRGEKVLFFPAKADIKRSIKGNFITDFWCYPMFKKYTPAGTMGILCNPQSPALAKFPTEFHSNWQWWRLVKNTPVVVLDATSKTYRPIIQVVDNFDRNNKLGLLFECKVGKGSLLVSSIPLPSLTDYLEANCLYQSLIDYMQSNAFTPTEIWDEQTLGNIFKLNL